jgi:hypothetical protein
MNSWKDEAWLAQIEFRQSSCCDQASGRSADNYYDQGWSRAPSSLINRNLNPNPLQLVPPKYKKKLRMFLFWHKKSNLALRNCENVKTKAKWQCFMDRQMILFSFIVFILLLSSVSSLEKSYSKILVVFPGVGFSNHNRTKTVFRNLRRLKEQNIFDCLMFTHSKFSQDFLNEIGNKCEIQYFPEGSYALYMKSVVPFVVREAGYTHIFILLDDVELGDQLRYNINPYHLFNLDRLEYLLTAMEKNNLSVISPTVEGAALFSTSSDKPSHSKRPRRINLFSSFGYFVHVGIADCAAI